MASDAASFYADVLASSGVYKYYCDGAWRESSSGKSVAVVNPSTRQAAYHFQGASADSIIPSPQLTPAAQIQSSWRPYFPMQPGWHSTGVSQD